jgi:hypothetical protein
MFPTGGPADSRGPMPWLTEVALDTVQQGIRSVLEKTARSLGESQLQGTEWRISDVKLGLSIDSNGQVSLLSVVKSQVGARATLDVTLHRS